MTLDNKTEKYRKAIEEFTLMDDTFMTAVFKDITCATLLINTILNKKLEIISVETQYNIKNLKGRSAVLDILAKDSEGRLYNCEVQNSDKGAIPERCRYHSSLIDSESLLNNEDWGNLPDTYVIIITRNDVLGGNLPIYHIERKITEMNNCAFGDRSYIVYVNASIQNNTELGRLMHDFCCKRAEDMYNKPLADTVGNYKKVEKGSVGMCDIMDRLIAEAVSEAVSEAVIENTIKTCNSLSISKKDTIDKLVADYNLTVEEATERVNELWAS